MRSDKGKEGQLIGIHKLRNRTGKDEEWRESSNKYKKIKKKGRGKGKENKKKHNGIRNM